MKNKEKMKKFYLFQKTASSLLLLLTILFLSPCQLKGQTNYYSPATNTLFGTSDSRLTATIKQSGDQVTMTIGAVGTVVADAFAFNVLYDTSSLRVANSQFIPILTTGTLGSGNNAIRTAITIEPELIARGFAVSPGAAIRRDNSYIADGTGYRGMWSFDAHIIDTLESPARIDVDAGDFVPLYTIYFKKSNTDLFDPATIGFNIRFGDGDERYPCWIYEGRQITYDETGVTIYPDVVNPAFFSYRSPSSVQTGLVTDVIENMATFNGTFRRGEVPPQYDLIDSVANVPRHTGKLLNDSIVRYGFFYIEGTDIVTFTHSEYSDSITINGTNYAFPTLPMITQGYFIAGTDTINIVVAGLSSDTITEPYSFVVTGLKPKTEYCMWAFAQYVFETSKPYPLVGGRWCFSTSQILNITSVFVAKDPTCDNTNGEIQVNVIGGSGSYQYSFDGVHFHDYPDGLITNLSAGSYRIYVRDANDTIYPMAVTDPIELRNINTDISLNLAVTNASNCFLSDGILHVSVGGGARPFIYTLNGAPDTVINGRIEDLAAGTYVLTVKDSLGCAIGKEINIASKTSMLALSVDSVNHTECNENIGEIYFTVTGSSYYKYQLDGMSVILATTSDQIVLSDLNAGKHTLTVWDTCGGVLSEEIYIYNTSDDQFKFTTITENVILACDGNIITKGSITINVENGDPTFRYSTDGSNWVYFTAGTHTATINDLREGMYYVQVVDTSALGCIFEENKIKISTEEAEQLQILAAHSTKAPDCNMPNGMIQVLAEGGSGTYKYSVNGGAFLSYTNDIITGLGAGTYTIVVQDASDLSCATGQLDGVILRDNATDLAISLEPINATTCSPTSGDGQLLVSVGGGSGNYTYSWGDGSTPAPVVTNGRIIDLPVGKYTVNVSDGSCSATSGEVEITSNASVLAWNLIESTTTICGAAVGTATFEVTDFTTNYTYHLDGLSPVGPLTHNDPITLSDLAAGVHILRISDGCETIENTIKINNGDENGLQFTYSSKNTMLSCDGNTMIPGSITLEVANGTPNYKYTIKGSEYSFAAGADTVTIFGLSEGAYTVQVTDSTGCAYSTYLITIGRENMPLLDINSIYVAEHPAACDDDGGKIGLYVTGGSGEYEYSLDGTTYLPYPSNHTIEGLVAKTYTVYIVDANYPTCASAQNTITLINTESDLTIEVYPYQASTCEAFDGGLFVSATGGDGINYTYIWEEDGTPATVEDGKIKELSVGKYVLQVISAGCTVSSGEKVITAINSVLATNIEVTSHTVCGASIGAVKFTVTKNGDKYWYKLNSQAEVEVSHNSPVVINGLEAGTHTLYIYDGCDEETKTFTITNGVNGFEFVYNVEDVKVACNGDITDGKIFLKALNGVPSYTYTIKGQKFDFEIGVDTVTILGLSEGLYTVEAMDTTGCTFKIALIEVGREIEKSVSIKDFFIAAHPGACNDDGGKIGLYVTGGSGEYQYSLDNITYQNFPSNSMIEGLIAGSYTIYMRDKNNVTCLPAVSEVLTLNNTESDLLITVVPSPALTCDDPNGGKLYVSVSGGNGTYAYTRNGNAEIVTNGVIENVPVGEHIIEVTSAGCLTSSGAVFITAISSELDVDIDIISHTVCGMKTGTVQFAVTANSTSYTYQLNNGQIIPINHTNPVILNNLSAGNYTLRITDSCDQITEEFIITNGTDEFRAIATTEPLQVACNGDVTGGKIFLKAIDGKPNYKYVIGGNEFHFAAGVDTVTIFGLSEGTYYVQVLDSTDCIFEINTINIGKETMPSLDIKSAYVAENPAACDDDGGKIGLHVVGGSGVYEYSLDGTSYLPYPSSEVIEGLIAGSYTVYIRDKNYPACSETQSKELVLNNTESDLKIDVNASEALTCDPLDNTGILYVSATGGSGDGTYKYEWADGSTALVVGGKIEGLSVGEYTLNVISEGCTTSSGKVFITAKGSILNAELEVTSHTLCNVAMGAVKVTVTSNSTQYWYQLNGEPVVYVTHNNPITINGLSAGKHTLYIYDSCDIRIDTFRISNGADGLQFTTDIQDVQMACTGDAIKGNIFLTVANGTPNYVAYLNDTPYPFAAGRDTLTISNLGVGLYHVVVKDITGCTYEENMIEVKIGDIPAVKIGTAFVATEPSCASSTGAIQFYVSGGSDSYQYRYSRNGAAEVGPFNYATTNGLISGLIEGSYVIRVWDAKYPTCPPAISEEIRLTNDDDFRVVLSTDSASDCTLPDGRLYVTIYGGTGSYAYTLNGASVPVSSQYVRPAGTYILEVNDFGHDCKVSSGEVRINAKSSTLDLDVFDITHTTCGIKTGSAKFAVSGATSYKYKLDAGQEVSMTTNDTVRLTGLAAGTYTLHVYNSCGEISKQIKISNGAGNLAFNVKVDNVGCGTEERNIELTVTSGVAPYTYSIDNGKTWSTQTNSTHIIISDVSTGYYDIILKDNENCEYVYSGILITPEGLISTPEAVSPQIFCIGATVQNLKVISSDMEIVWYATPHGGTPLSINHLLDSGATYYAAQRIGYCESQVRKEVKVRIDNNMVLLAPIIESEQSFCPLAPPATLTLGDIATDGNPNIVWYDQYMGGTLLPITTPLADSVFYFAATKSGDCESPTRAQILVRIGATPPDSVLIISPQSFCKGATISNIKVPNDKVVWYATPTSTDPLLPTMVLGDTVTYYAAQKAGSCESINRTAVLVYLNGLDLPVIPQRQTTCGGNATLADLHVSGYSIVWYASDTDVTPLPSNTPLVVGNYYYAAQKGSEDCESGRVPVEITDQCFTLKGTIFPFVHDLSDALFNTRFPVTISVYEYPNSIDCDGDPIAFLRTQTPRFTTMAVYHDGSEFIDFTPKYPGKVGAYNNPGFPINWTKVTGGITPPSPNGALLTPTDNIPQTNSKGERIGKYAIEDVPEGNYMIVFSREGFVTRIGKITVTAASTDLGHRELVPGAVNRHSSVTSQDVSGVKAKYSAYGEPNYDPRYDVNGDGYIDVRDFNCIRSNNSANYRIYEETWIWLDEECDLD